MTANGYTGSTPSGGGGAVSSVAGRTGDVVLVKADVGLGNVTNTADSAKPVSTLQQAALDLKLDKAGGTVSGALSVGGTLTAASGLINIGADVNLYRDNADVLGTDDAFHIKGNLYADGLASVSGGAEVVDSTLTVKKSTGAQFRWRATGAAIDIDKTGQDIYVSNFDGATPFTGTQTNIMRWRNDGVTMVGRTDFGADAAGNGQVIDAANGQAKLGNKNSTANIVLSGRSGTTGAPTTGTWSVSDVLMDDLGRLMICTGAGNPGSWTFLTKAGIGLGNVDNTADASKTFTESQVTNLVTDLAAKAPLASPTFTGTPAAPTATAGASTTQIATTAFTAAAVTNALSLLGVWTPGQANLAGANGDPGADPQGGTVMATGGLLLGTRIQVVSATVTNIVMHLVSGGGTLTAGGCFAGLYSDAGTLLSSSADQATNWGSGGLKTIALAAPQTVTPGTFVKVGWYFTGTTGPSISRMSNIANVLANVGLSSPNFRWFTANTGLTTALPGTIGTMTSFITTYWVGLS